LSNVGDYQVLRASPARIRDPEAGMSVDLSEALISGSSSNVEHYQTLEASPVLNIDQELGFLRRIKMHGPPTTCIGSEHGVQPLIIQLQRRPVAQK
jgi:hypothetical protein